MITGLALLVLALTPADTTMTPLQRLLADDWQYRMEQSPESATFLGDHRYDGRLTDLSIGAIEARQAHDRAMLARARAIKPASLKGQDRLSLELFLWEKSVDVDGQRFPTWRMPLDQLDGVQLAFPQLIAAMPHRTAQDYDNYVARLNAFPRFIGQTIALLREGIRTGWVQPAFQLRGIPAQIEPQLVTDPAASPVYAPVTAFPAEVDEAARARIVASARRAILDSVVPALRALNDFVQREYLPAGRKQLAATSLPGGSDYYTWQIRRYTTVALSAATIHQLGLDEVQRIRLAMDSVQLQVGFSGGFAEFLQFLRTDPRFYLTSADALVEGYRDIAKKIDGGLPSQFAILPRTPYGVRAFPDYEGPSQTTARYYPSAADGSRAGFMMVNTWQLDARPTYEMEALTLHEAMPGHHLQIARAQELEGLPEFRRNAAYTAYVEGWALYAEQLGRDLGLYTDPYSRFGQLTYEMWRACRLVIDTGIHTMGWSRDSAIAYLLANSAKSAQDAAVEVDRYIVWPGQALAYKIGELRITAIRRQAETALGDRFDVRRFHNALLDEGPMPLEVLQTQMDLWIAAEQSGRSHGATR